MIAPSSWDYLKRLRWSGAGPEDRNIVVDRPDRAASLDAMRRALEDCDDPERIAIRAERDLSAPGAWFALYGLEGVAPGVWADPGDEFGNHPFVAGDASCRASK